MQKNSNCHLIGIDLGGTSTKLGLFDTSFFMGNFHKDR